MNDFQYDLTLKTPPATEPLTLAEVKDFLKISDFADTSSGLTIEELILPATQIPGTITTTGVDVLSYTPVVEINAGTLLATATLNIRIQESADNIAWANWYSFAQITPANDNQSYQHTYTGDKRYIRLVATLANANGDYSVNLILNQGYTAEDAYLTTLITAARQFCENFQHKAYITQVWEMTMAAFPSYQIELPRGNLITVDSITYKDSTGATTTLTATTDYVTSIRGVKGKVVPAYNKTWPVFTPYPLDAVTITFTCGYGAASAVPELIKQAIKLEIAILKGDLDPVDTEDYKQARDSLLQTNGVMLL